MPIRWYLNEYLTKTGRRKGGVKCVVAHFEKTGCSMHSDMGKMMRPIVDHCEENGIPYRIIAYPGYGYKIEKIPKWGQGE